VPILRLTDGQKRLLLSLPGVWQHEWLLVREHALSQQQDAFRDSEICGTLCDIGRAMERDGQPHFLLTHPRSGVPVPALEGSSIFPE
jgi:hypothetical protein